MWLAATQKREPQYFGFSSFQMGGCRWVPKLLRDLRGCLLESWQGTCNASPSPVLTEDAEGLGCWLAAVLLTGS